MWGDGDPHSEQNLAVSDISCRPHSVQKKHLVLHALGDLQCNWPSLSFGESRLLGVQSLGLISASLRATVPHMQHRERGREREKELDGMSAHA
jgi:hypothetical protein